MKYLGFVLFFFTLAVQAQFQLNGIVKEASTNKPLAYASLFSGKKLVAITDNDGKFNLTNDQPFSEITVSYLGFFPYKIQIDKNKNFYSISLIQDPNHLKEVFIGAKNPAINIIQKVIANKDQNNPQKKLSSFEFKCYNKLIVTANSDSISAKIDTVFSTKSFKKNLIKLDSTNYKFKEMIQKQHLFLTEKVSQFQFQNHHLKETILGLKMAGLKQPIFEILGFNLQSFSIYDPKYELFEIKYNSPISTSAPKEYQYQLLDIGTIENRPVFIIYFKNKRKKSGGLEGILYVDQQSFAVAKASMRIKGVINVTATHDFNFISENGLWFPSTKSIKLVKGSNDDDIKILGGTIQFKGDITDFSNRGEQASDHTYILSKSTNFDFNYQLNSPVKRSAIAIEIGRSATKRPDSFWNSYRKDSLDSRSQKTYTVLDSLAIKRQIERKIIIGRRLIKGFLPSGPIDFDLRKFISFNNHEGFHLGIGGVTNAQFSKKIKIDAYTAYGTKDGSFKHHLGLSTRLGERTNSWIGMSFTDDVREIASTQFAVDSKNFKIYDPRPFNISTFYNYVSWKAFLETKIIPKTESIWELSQNVIDPKFNYSYLRDGVSFSKYTITSALVSIKWNPFSDYMQTPTGRVEVEKRYPKFTFQITKSAPKFLKNDFNFGKIDFRTEYEQRYLNGQKTAVLFQAGYTFGEIPLTHAYSVSPNNLNKETVFQRLTFEGKNSFETMFYNEFFSSEFAFFQLKHSFSRVKIAKKVRPSLVLVSRIAWGDMQNKNQHQGLEFKTLNKGYIESGIELNQIYKGIGLVGFYRYGPNGLLRFQDNLALKISFNLDLGF